MNKNTKQDFSRRNFLSQSAKSLALLASANVGVYVIGSAFKELDGGMVAGAKLCECMCWMQAGQCGASFNSLNESCFVVSPTCAELPNPGCEPSGNKIIQGCMP